MLSPYYLYFGVKGYFTDFDFLKDFEKPKKQPQNFPDASLVGMNEKLVERKEEINKLFREQKIFLDPELNLTQLSEKTRLNRAEVSEIINLGFGKNFNDFVNQYRIEEFKRLLSGGDHQQFSLVGLAFEYGFNSKATFKRVFKKEVKLTPTEYLNTLKNQDLK